MTERSIVIITEEDGEHQNQEEHSITCRYRSHTGSEDAINNDDVDNADDEPATITIRLPQPRQQQPQRSPLLWRR
jgi:hypothetical protein